MDCDKSCVDVSSNVDLVSGFMIVGEFLLDRCPNEVILLMMNYLKVPEIIQVGMICRLFHKIVFFWMRNRKIRDERVICNMISQMPGWIPSVIEIHGFDNDFLIEKLSEKIWRECSTVLSRKRGRRNAGRIKKVWGKKNSKYKKTRDQLLEEAKKREKSRALEMEERKKKKIALMAIISKCEPSVKESRFLENLLFEILMFCTNSNEYSGVLEFITAFSENDNVDFLFDNNRALRTLIPNFYGRARLKEDVFCLLFQISKQYDPKKLFFVPPPNMSNIYSPPCSEKKRTTPSISWYDYATDADLNYILFKEHRLSPSIMSKWGGGKPYFPILCFCYWKALGLKTRIWRKTGALILEICRSTSLCTEVTNEIMDEDVCEIVDKDKWGSDCDENDDDFVPTMYQCVMKRGDVEFLIKEYSLPILLSDIYSACEVGNRNAFHCMMWWGHHLFPKNWTENEDLLRKGFTYCFSTNSVQTGETNLKAFCVALDQQQHLKKNEEEEKEEKRSKRLFTKFSKFIWSLIIDMYYNLKDDYYSSDRRILDFCIEAGLPTDDLSVLMDQQEKPGGVVCGILAFLLTERNKYEGDLSEKLATDLKKGENVSLLIKLFDFSLSHFEDGKQLSFGRLSSLLKGRIRTRKVRKGLDYLFLYILVLFFDELPHEVKEYSYIFKRLKVGRFFFEDAQEMKKKTKSVVSSQLKVCGKYFYYDKGGNEICAEKKICACRGGENSERHVKSFSIDVLKV